MSSNIRESEPDDPFRRRERRPSSVTLIAVFHVIFGGFGLVCGLCSGLTQAMNVASAAISKSQPAPVAGRALTLADLTARQQRFLEEEVPFYNATVVTQIVVTLLQSIVLIIAGIGLFSMRSWARRLSVVFGIVGSLYHFAELVYSFMVQIPAINAFYRDVGRKFPGAPVASIEMIGVWIGIAMTLAELAYPIVVLMLLTQPKVVAAFERRPALPDVSDLDLKGDSSGPASDAFTR
jgi:hypothetical protein